MDSAEHKTLLSLPTISKGNTFPGAQPFHPLDAATSALTASPSPAQKTLTSARTQPAQPHCADRLRKASFFHETRHPRIQGRSAARGSPWDASQLKPPYSFLSHSDDKKQHKEWLICLMVPRFPLSQQGSHYSRNPRPLVTLHPQSGSREKRRAQLSSLSPPSYVAQDQPME